MRGMGAKGAAPRALRAPREIRPLAAGRWPLSAGGAGLSPTRARLADHVSAPGVRPTRPSEGVCPRTRVPGHVSPSQNRPLSALGWRPTMNADQEPHNPACVGLSPAGFYKLLLHKLIHTGAFPAGSRGNQKVWVCPRHGWSVPARAGLSPARARLADHVSAPGVRPTRPRLGSRLGSDLHARPTRPSEGVCPRTRVPEPKSAAFRTRLAANDER